MRRRQLALFPLPRRAWVRRMHLVDVSAAQCNAGRPGWIPETGKFRNPLLSG